MLNVKTQFQRGGNALSVIESSLSPSLTMHSYTVTLCLPGPLISLVPSDSHFSSSIVLAFPGLGKTYSLIHEDLRDCLGVSTRPKQFVNSMVHLTEIRVLCTVPYLSTWPIKAISSWKVPCNILQTLRYVMRHCHVPQLGLWKSYPPFHNSFYSHIEKCCAVAWHQSGHEAIMYFCNI